MRIVTVSFRSSVSIGRYQHAHIEASAGVSETEDPSDVLRELKLWVAKELVITKKGREVPFTELLGGPNVPSFGADGP